MYYMTNYDSSSVTKHTTNKRVSFRSKQNMGSKKIVTAMTGTSSRHNRLLRVVMLVLIIAVAACGGAIVHTYAAQPGITPTSKFEQAIVSANQVAYDRITVNAGETLWSIATEFAPKGVSVRDYMRKIQKVNAMSSTSLQAGQSLLIP
ncbi:LysM peptidoglycan-binding domain-containing protein [Paenibacillus sp. KN14-4R]|uniref:LysM peptidoglycan-binding domain-containing protein n=1 Tax=Paenibacillus sp. KN14-4R TaxID=3445773 RepID=UPI003FA0AF45